MNKKWIWIVTIIAAFAVAAAVVSVVLLNDNNRPEQHLLTDCDLLNAVVYEDVNATYQYSAKLDVSGTRVRENTHINYKEKLEHKLIVDYYEGISQRIGLCVFINGIPQEFNINGVVTSFYLFDPGKEDRLDFWISPNNCGKKNNKVSIVLICEFDVEPEYYLDSVSNYTNAINYWIDDAPDQAMESLVNIESSGHMAASILKESTSVCAIISDQAGLGTQKFLAQDSGKSLYLNVYGKPGAYVATAFCGCQMYNAFGDRSSVCVTVHQDELATVQMAMPELTDNLMRNVYCILIPISDSDSSIYDSAMLSIVYDQAMINDASTMAFRFHAETDEELTGEEMIIRVSLEASSVPRTYRVLTLIDETPQKMKYNGSESYLLSVNESVEDFSFSISPDMNCEYDQLFKVDIVLLQDGSENILSEDYMMDYAFANEVKTLRVKNVNRKFEKDATKTTVNRIVVETISDSVNLNLLFPKSEPHYRHAFCNYFVSSEPTINLSCLLTLPDINESNDYLSFAVVNGELVPCFNGYAFFNWTGEGRAASFDITAALKEGINKIYTVTLFRREGRVQRLVSRATVLYREEFQRANDVALSYAFNDTAAVFAIGSLSGDISYQSSIFAYGYQSDETMVTDYQLPTRNINAELEPANAEIITLHSLSLNSGAASIHFWDHDALVFVKYKLYGYTN